MTGIVLFEDEGYLDLLPLVYWRTVFELRIGRGILLDLAAQRLGRPVAGVWVRDWISAVASNRCGAPTNRPIDGTTTLINGRWLAQPGELPAAPAVGVIGQEIAYIVCDKALASKLSPRTMLDVDQRRLALEGVPTHEASGSMIRYPWDIIAGLPAMLDAEFQVGVAAIDADLDAAVMLEQPERMRISERTRIHPTAVIDAGSGPVMISHDVTVGAYAVIEGPAYIGPGTRINPHAWLHGGNACGPVCKLGGEIDGCVIQGYTNKQHAGFLGHAYVGSWVNLGAGATNSDLKNTYGSVRVPWRGTDVDTGQRFFGAIIADHVKMAINSTIPTGAVIGFAANVATGRIVPKSVPSFGWVTDDGVRAGDPPRLLDTAVRVMARRDVEMTDAEVELFLDLPARTLPLE